MPWLANMWSRVTKSVDQPRQGPPAQAFAMLSEAIAGEFEKYKVFMVVGPARSGTTATIRTLGLASNVEIFSEPLPRLGVDVRRYELNLLDDPMPLIWSNRIERIREVISKGKLYGEKDQQIYCWLPYYRQLFNPRILLVRRDGRDSVRSLFNHHYDILGSLYREVQDEHLLSPQARAHAAALPKVEEDPVDMMRQRPTPGDPAFFEWPTMSRLEMIAWYWSAYVRIVQRDLYNMKRGQWEVVDFKHENHATRFEQLYAFLDLEGFDREAVERSLESRHGALTHQLKDPSKESTLSLGAWPDWPDHMITSFDRYAASAMVQCGYYGIEKLPTCDGARTLDQPLMHAEHDTLTDRVAGILQSELLPKFAPFEQILIIGKSPSIFETAKVTVWNGDRLSEIPNDRFDLVLALGMIDQAPDMDQLLIALATRTRRMLVIAARWGHFDHLIEHEYRWGKDGRGHHRWSITKARALLQHALGFPTTESIGLETKDHVRPSVSVLVGSRQASDRAILT